MPDSIGPFIHRKVVVLATGATAFEAARAMCERGVGSVVVSDGDGHMVGIVTDRDLTCAIVGANFDSEIDLAEVMTTDLATVDESAALSDVIGLMKDKGVRRVPVVQEVRGKAQRCIGLISLDDLIAARVIEMEDVSAIVRAQIFRRQRSLPEWRGRDVQSRPSTDEFLRDVEKETGLSKQASRSFAGLVLGLIVRRMHFTSAARFIAHVPASLRDELMDLPAGPDHSIDSGKIVSEVTSRFDIDSDAAKGKLRGFWRALSAAIHQPFEMGHIDDEMPESIRGLFIDLPKGQETASRDVRERPSRPET